MSTSSRSTSRAAAAHSTCLLASSRSTRTRSRPRSEPCWMACEQPMLDPTISTHIESWYADFVREGGRAGRGIDYIVQQAQTKAEQYREMGSAYDDFQPGN